MKVNLYAVLDTASGVYDGPVPSKTDGTAMRSFTQMAKNPESPIGQSPSDFSLWKVGVWNDATGELVETRKECLAYAVDLLTPEEVN
jgi:hypothetical protein